MRCIQKSDKLAHILIYLTPFLDRKHGNMQRVYWLAL